MTRLGGKYKPAEHLLKRLEKANSKN